MTYRTPPGIYPQVNTAPRITGGEAYTPDLRSGLILRSVFEGVPNTRFVRAGDPTPRAVMISAQRNVPIGQMAQFPRTTPLMPVSPVRSALF